MEQVIFGGVQNQVPTTPTEYTTLWGAALWNANEDTRRGIVSADGVIKNLRVMLDGSPGAGKHYTFTVMLNGAPTALTLDIANLVNTGNNMVDEVVVTSGDSISFQCDPDGDPTARIAWWTTMFEGSTSKESLVMGLGTSLNTEETRYTQIFTSYNWLTNVENDHRQVIPTAGTLRDFYVELGQVPGFDPGDAYRFTVRLNGATVAQSLIVTITQPATSGSDLVHNLVVAAGDVVTMMVEPLIGPDLVPDVWWGMTFEADIDGESIVLGGTNNDLPTIPTEYNAVTSNIGEVWVAIENQRYQLGQVCTVKKLHILLSAAPGDGNKYTFTIRANGDTNVVAEVADPATTGNSGALEDNVTNDQKMSLKVVPTDTPDVADAYWGFVGYIEPPPGWTGKISGVTNPAEIAGVAFTDIAEVKGVA